MRDAMVSAGYNTPAFVELKYRWLLTCFFRVAKKLLEEAFPLPTPTHQTRRMLATKWQEWLELRPSANMRPQAPKYPTNRDKMHALAVEASKTEVSLTCP